MHLKSLIVRQLSHLTNPPSPSSLINTQIRNLVKQKQHIEALKLYSENPNFPTNITKFTFPSLLKACALTFNLHYGKSLHTTITYMGLQSDLYITTSLVDMYVKCGSLQYAVKVFDELCKREGCIQDVSVWNSMIDGYFRFGCVEDGVGLFCRMQWFNVKPDAYSLSILLGVCGNGDFRCKEGKQIHGYIARHMFNHDPFLDTAVIDMYLRCGMLKYAWCVFEKLGDRSSVVVWNVMIGGFSEKGLWECSLELYSLAKEEGIEFVSTSFSNVLRACGSSEDASFGMQVHSDVIKMGFESDPYVYTSLLTMYGKCKLIEAAEEIFYRIQHKKIEVWNAMISAYVNNNLLFDALEIYKQMRTNAIQSDVFTMLNMLSSSSILQLHDLGKSVHGELIKRPVLSSISIQSALLTMYSKCGSDADAKLVFTAMEEKDVVVFGSMISGYCYNSKFNKALDVFAAMEADGVKPDSDIMVSVISACSGLENVDLGTQIHGFVIKNGYHLDLVVASSLIDMYSKCSSLDSAEKVFSRMLHKNLVTWNSMISCYVRSGFPEHSIELFPQIHQHGFHPDSVSITIVLGAISSVAALIQGKIVHGHITRHNIQSDIHVENALIDMYIKCGFLKYARYIFETMLQKDLVTWNSMITGYGSHGECLKALSLFDDMKSSGIRPDAVTFLCLLSSCNHSGLVEAGLNLFKSMRTEYGIEPKMEHYVNMVDLLGRAGKLDDAYDFVRSMPVEPDRSVWLSLLCACRTHRRVELGEIAADKLMKLEPRTGSNYVHLLNLYGEAQMWDKAADLRASMREMDLKKQPGCSWIEVKNKVDVFVSGDSSSAKTIEIYETLNSLRCNMKKKLNNFICLVENEL